MFAHSVNNEFTNMTTERPFEGKRKHFNITFIRLLQLRLVVPFKEDKEKNMRIATIN